MHIFYLYYPVIFTTMHFPNKWKVRYKYIILLLFLVRKKLPIHDSRPVHKGTEDCHPQFPKRSHTWYPPLGSPRGRKVPSQGLPVDFGGQGLLANKSNWNRKKSGRLFNMHQTQDHTEGASGNNRGIWPCQRVGKDLFRQNEKTYMVAIDYFSCYIEMSYHVASAKIFAQHVVPMGLLSDNGLQFAATQFKDFARQYDFTHMNSSPWHPQANGEAEPAVARALLKAYGKREETMQKCYSAIEPPL